MPKVHILPDIIINKIAAGEVVERPASIVKELVENSLDARSSIISVDIEDGGKRLIKISDNGSGMDYDDALLAIERHATSKLETDADLFSISTLGFRGEALPSIASISGFTLETRTKESETGVRISMNGGKLTAVEESGCAAGTHIQVKSIFFNTPARRKFLKTSSTEMAHITETLLCLALPWPAVSFRLSADGNAIKNLPAVSSPFERVVDILGKDLRKSLIYIESETPSVTLSGWISEPDVTRGSGQKIYLFVNGRYVKDRGVIHALCDAYRESLMKGRFPMAVLFMDVPPETVDVNVHPAKQEVRFSRHQEIYTAVRSAACDALRKRAPAGSLSADEIPSVIFRQTFSKPADTLIFREPEYQKTFSGSNVSEKILSFQIPFSEDFPVVSEPTTRSQINTEKKSFSFFNSLRIAGQIKNTYILCDSASGLVIFDQHAAHERIAYEKLQRFAQGEKGVSVQRLLVPEIVELSSRETRAFIDMLPELFSMGIETEHFGENSFAVRSVPSIIPESEIKNLLHDIAEKTVEFAFRKPERAEIFREYFAVMACHSAIRSGQELAPSEIRNLLNDLSECENPFHCPHGRPTYILISGDEIEKKFGRRG